LEQNFPDEVETFRERRVAAAAVSIPYLVFYWNRDLNNLAMSLVCSKFIVGSFSVTDTRNKLGYVCYHFLALLPFS